MEGIFLAGISRYFKTPFIVVKYHLSLLREFVTGPEHRQGSVLTRRHKVTHSTSSSYRPLIVSRHSLHPLVVKGLIVVESICDENSREYVRPKESGIRNRC